MAVLIPSSTWVTKRVVDLDFDCALAQPSGESGVKTERQSTRDVSHVSIVLLTSIGSALIHRWLWKRTKARRSSITPSGLTSGKFCGQSLFDTPRWMRLMHLKSDAENLPIDRNRV